ncbi:MAG: hypothetical protein GF332_04350 [Candidatus Moranbacteria bacterium]|nr:hypothetical protein [Candidatus Moranbacteria bacterium]
MEEKKIPTFNVKQRTERKSDTEISDTIETSLIGYFDGLRKLRRSYATKLFYLLSAEVAVMGVILIFSGMGVLAFDEWLVALFAETVLVQTAVTIRIVVKNLFPENKLESEILNFFSKKNDLS